jgi:hypothetical protein
MSKSLAFTLPLGIYPYDIRFSFNEKSNDIERHFKKIGCKKSPSIKYDDKSCVAFYIRVNSRNVLIRMRRIPDSADEFSWLQHEITHAVMFILDKYTGMPHTPESTEAYAYLTDYITKEVYRNLPKFK